ncbi:Crp/Fnr family transcriptional regulator [Sporolactobacillus shoreae]|uniref:Crp/Fnr family transcriptional regulator n=1 Tax=Sporolactobacillus shoreae TaxID=1465501 RepID=A0A4Z0GKW4_9BACL|nr:Crp/Fnr family transcriptional regulator [Sporolactobacillus shoreae]TGA96751.1 Crp/Fnr family transcriptional regulator [Sporolactobacillus shoreae]
MKYPVIVDYFQSNNASIIKKSKNEYITYSGLSTSYVWLLKEGVVKSSLILKDGREFNVAYLQKGDIVSLLREDNIAEPLAPYNVRVETECAYLYQVNRIAFWQDVYKNRDLQREVYRFYRKELEDAILKIRDFSMSGKKEALYTILLRFARKFGVPFQEGILIDFVITNEELAKFAGISTRNSVNRMLHQLREKEIIEIVQSKIYIKNIQFLEENVVK